jgi:hypothetical protein
MTTPIAAADERQRRRDCAIGREAALRPPTASLGQAPAFAALARVIVVPKILPNEVG